MTFFLDTLHAWFQASESAPDEEGTAVPLDLSGVHAAYTQLDESVQAQTSLEWSHFLQACTISPPHYQWIWLAIEDLAAALGYDGSYFDPDLAFLEPEPDAEVDITLTEREVEWARHIFFSMYEQVHGHRPDGTAAITNDMDETQRFLKQLSALVIYFPVLSNDGVVSLRHESLDGESLFVAEQDITLLFRCYEALPEGLREAVEPEWVELGSAIYDANAFRFRFRSLYERMAAKLEPVDMEAFEDAPTAPLHRVNGRTRLAVVRADSDSGQTTISHQTPGSTQAPAVRQASDDRGNLELAPLPSLPRGQAAPLFVGPVPVPKHLDKPRTRKTRLKMISGVFVASAAVALALLVPNTPNPAQAPEVTRTSQPTILSLPITPQDHPTCESSNEQSTPRPAAALPAPKTRKTSTVPFLTGTESVILKRKNKPNLKVTVTEVANDGAPLKKAENSPARTYAIDVDELTDQGLTMGIDDSDHKNDVQIVLEHSP